MTKCVYHHMNFSFLNVKVKIRWNYPCVREHTPREYLNVIANMWGKKLNSIKFSMITMMLMGVLLNLCQIRTVRSTTIMIMCVWKKQNIFYMRHPSIISGRNISAGLDVYLCWTKKIIQVNCYHFLVLCSFCFSETRTRPTTQFIDIYRSIFYIQYFIRFSLIFQLSLNVENVCK